MENLTTMHNLQGHSVIRSATYTAFNSKECRHRITFVIDMDDQLYDGMMVLVSQRHDSLATRWFDHTNQLTKQQRQRRRLRPQTMQHQ